MKLDLTGKTALVSASTAGIGLATAEGLAALGAHVWVNGRTAARVDSAIAAIKKAEPKAKLSPLVADLGTATGAQAAFNSLPEADILVNNLGTVNVRKSFDELTDADWTELFELNVMSGVRLTRHYLPGMRKKNWGRVVFVSSESGVQIPPEFLHYGVTKTANIAVARGIAETLVGSGVTVNSVLPGPTWGDGTTKRFQASGQSEAEFTADIFTKRRPTSLIQRMTSTEEVANMIVYICSPASSATHGAALRAEGGIVKSLL